MVNKPLKEEAVFKAACRFGSLRDRADYVGAACQGDRLLQRRINSLLRIFDEDSSFLEPEVSAQNILFDLPKVEPVGTLIGCYKLLEPIGEGGMGTVYKAEQNEPVHRQVALKLIKPGMDTRQVIARFEAEEQALAVMDHPNIAKVFDAGATESGRPYFVMELVNGIPIDQFCDEHQLDTKQRLELFIQVCHGVQHAHQKGIIHRDLKPSNILVAMYDNEPVPKVIDFGLAKATGERLTEKTTVTRLGQVMGTLRYMSPEQTQQNRLDVDTRSDIYSLGAILYELLTGNPPFAKERVKNQALDETLRMIREEEPPKPSAKISSSANLAAIAADRQIQPQKLFSLVRGDLDWIVMKAMEKDRKRRYQTANNLADDVQNYLDDQPVLAGPPSAMYRLKKFTRRHSGKLIATCLITSALVLATVVSAWQAIRATNAEQRALNEAMRAKEANQITLAVQEFFNKDILLQASPYKQKRGITLIEVLDIAGEKVGKQFPDQPVVEAEIREALFEAYSSLGEYEKARVQAEKSKDLFEQHLGKDDAKTLYADSALAFIGAQLGNLDQAVAELEQIVASCESVLGSNHRVTQEASNWLAIGYRRQRKSDLAAKRFQWLKDHAIESELKIKAIGNLGVVRLDQGKLGEASELQEEAYTLGKQLLGEDHYLVVHATTQLANVFAAHGEFAKALPLDEKAWELQKSVLGEDHPATAATAQSLANSLLNLGRWEDAEELLERQRALLESMEGVAHHKYVNAINLSATYRRLGKLDAAEKLARDVYAQLRADVGMSHNRTLSAAKELTTVLDAMGNQHEADRIWNDVQKLLEDSLRENPEKLGCRRVYLNQMFGQAEIFRRRHAYQQEADLFQRAVEIQRQITKLQPNDLSDQRLVGALLMEQAIATKNSASGQPVRPYGRVELTSTTRKFLEKSLSLYEEAEEILQPVFDLDPANESSIESLAKNFQNKASVLNLLKRYGEAVIAMGKACDVGGRTAREELTMQIYESRMLARAGDYQAATDRLAKIVATEDVAESRGDQIARVYAVCARAVMDDESLPADERKHESNRFDELAIENIRTAMNSPDGIRDGQFEVVIESDDFETIRARPDFQELLERVKTRLTGLSK